LPEPDSGMAAFSFRTLAGSDVNSAMDQSNFSRFSVVGDDES
jgi:hypothetical protein